LFVLITRLAYGKKLNTKAEPTEESPLKIH